MSNSDLTEQEKFDNMLEDYMDSVEGQASLHDLFADFLKTPEGIAAVRTTMQHDDGSLSSAQISTGGTTTTQAPGSVASTPAKSPAAAATTTTTAAAPQVDELSKYDLVETLDLRASKQWIYNHLDTIRGRGLKQVIAQTAAHI